MATIVFSRKVVAIVLLFAVVLLSLFIAFQTCGSAAFFIVVFWAIAPFFALYLYREHQKGKGKARKRSKKGAKPPSS